MKSSVLFTAIATNTLIGLGTLSTGKALAAESGYSVVPYLGGSFLGGQAPVLSGTTDIADGVADVSVDTGFTAGLSVRYDYPGRPWTSEFGWEYRSNDSATTLSDGVLLPAGNYASNIFYLNGRYSLTAGNTLTPWVGAGLTWIQEIDLDSEDASSERSFSDSGAVGYQLMIGADYDLTDRLYLTGELRYTSHTGLELYEESGAGRVSEIDYQPVTLGVGLGYRF